MENQTPHEVNIHENDFKRFYHETFQPFWDRYGTPVSLVICVVCAIFAGRQWWNYQHRETNERAWTDVATSTSPEAFYKVAADHRTSRPAVAATAWLAGADLNLKKAREIAAKPEDKANAEATGDVVKPTSAEDYLSNAYTGYDAVATMAGVDPVFRLNAMLGLAAVAEGKLEWEQAGKIYEVIEKEAGDTYPMLQARAKARLELLPRLKLPVTFVATSSEASPFDVVAPKGDGLKFPTAFEELMDGSASDEFLPESPLPSDDTTPAEAAPEVTPDVSPEATPEAAMDDAAAAPAVEAESTPVTPAAPVEDQPAPAAE